MNNQFWMARALQLAAKGLYSTQPNPRVGCVLVKNNQLVGSGWHRQAGTEHAEIHALRAAGEQARGATAYVSLEPCSHQGRTGPCALALVQAGVSKVVVAMQDPNPQVAGRGVQMLRDAGIAVELLEGELNRQAQQLNRGFCKRMQQGLPWVSVKLAMSLDGRTAMASGESQWITGAAARADVQLLRARSCAIVSGADTVLLDNARLTIRAEQLPLAPWQQQLALHSPRMRVLIDSRQRVGHDSAFYQAGAAWLASFAKPARLAENAGWLPVAEHNGQVDLADLLRLLADKHQVNEVLVEAGARLAGAFLQAGLIDELVIYMAGKLLGSNARPLFELPLELMANAPQIRIEEIRKVGQDWRMLCYPLGDTAGTGR